MMQPIIVAVADDHRIFRKGVILSLKPYNDFKFTIEAEDGESLIEQIYTAKPIPDIVLMDLRMDGMNGIDATAYIKRYYPSIKVVMLTMYEDRNIVLHLKEIGANAYLLKSVSPEEIADVIKRVHAGEIVFDLLERKDYIE